MFEGSRLGIILNFLFFTKTEGGLIVESFMVCRHGLRVE